MVLVSRNKSWFSGGHYARRNPYPLMLWLAIGSSTILFLFILVMLVLRKTAGLLPPLHLPWAFFISTLLLCTSSLTLMQARYAFKKEKYSKHTRYTTLTLILGVGFLVFQIDGWVQILQQGYTLQDNVTTAFLFILSGLHVTHLAGAIGLVVWVLSDSLTNKSYVDGYLQSLNPAKQTRMQLAYWFWHFTDALWLLLFLVFWIILNV